MFCGVLLMRKGILLNEATIDVVKSKTNSFGLKMFQDFLGSQACLKMYQDLVKDNSVYYNLQSHLQSKLKEEIGITAQNSMEIFRLSTDPKVTLKDVQEKLKQETYWLLDYYTGSKHRLSQELQKELAIALAHLYVGTYCESEFAYKTEDNIVFDWVTFERQLNMVFITNKLMSACKTLGINPPA